METLLKLLYSNPHQRVIEILEAYLSHFSWSNDCTILEER